MRRVSVVAHGDSLVARADAPTTSATPPITFPSQSASSLPRPSEQLQILQQAHQSEQ